MDLRQDSGQASPRDRLGKLILLSGFGEAFRSLSVPPFLWAPGTLISSRGVLEGCRMRWCMAAVCHPRNWFELMDITECRGVFLHLAALF